MVAGFVARTFVVCLIQGLRRWIGAGIGSSFVVCTNDIVGLLSIEQAESVPERNKSFLKEHSVYVTPCSHITICYMNREGRISGRRRTATTVYKRDTVQTIREGLVFFQNVGMPGFRRLARSTREEYTHRLGRA